ncbi:MAG: hypothetical protein RJA36_1305 [Pseudomonadota bacterium]|jgi:hypothetical protein
MSVAVSVQIDAEQVADARALFEFVGGNSADALRVAINKAAPKIKTLASRKIRDQVRLPAAYVSERLTLRRATRAALSGAIQTPSRGLLLSRFATDSTVASDKVGWIRPPKVPAGGIKVKVKPDGSTKSVHGGPGTTGKVFYVVLNGGNNVGIAARLAGEKRKIKVLSGPSLSQVFNTVRDEVLPEAGQELTDQLLDAMRYLLVMQYPLEEAP